VVKRVWGPKVGGPGLGAKRLKLEESSKLKDQRLKLGCAQVSKVVKKYWYALNDTIVKLFLHALETRAS